MEQLELELIFPDKDVWVPSQMCNLEAKYTRDWFMYGRTIQKQQWEEKRRNPERCRI